MAVYRSNPGGFEYYNQAQWGTSCTATGLPADGSTVYVRLYTHFASGYQYNDYTYTAASGGTSVLGQMTSPQSGTTLSGTSQEFIWSAGNGDGLYWISIGKTTGGIEYYNQASWTTSCIATGLPTDGSTVYVRLYTHFSTGYEYVDYAYTATNSGGVVLAQMTSPIDGATINADSQEFIWSEGNGDGLYWMSIGTSPGGIEYYNAAQWSTSCTVTGLPTGATMVYVRLYTHFATGYQYNDYTYSSVGGYGNAALVPVAE